MMVWEISQSEKGKYHPVILLICLIEVTDKQTETLRDRVRQREREQTIKKQTLKIREQSDSTVGVVGCTAGW